MIYKIIYSNDFKDALESIRDSTIKDQIKKKVEEAYHRAPIGKKLQGNKFWSIHVNKYRIIYEIKGTDICIIDILKRKHEYREL